MTDKSIEHSRLVLDITDLLVFLRHNPNVSGIQRFAVAVINELPHDACLVFWKDGTLRQVAGTGSPLQRLVRHIELSRMRAAFKAARLISCRKIERGYRAYFRPTSYAFVSSAFKFKKTDRFVVLGALWDFPDYLQFLRAQKRHVGFEMIVFVHDIIPYCGEQFVSYEAYQRFRKYADWFTTEADSLMTNSEYSRKTILGLSPLVDAEAVKVVPLAHAFSPVRLRSRLKPEDYHIRERVYDLTLKPFALCVGTFEPRKNQIAMIAAWQRMRIPQSELPQLVLAGKWGWNSDSIKIALERENTSNIVLIEHPNDDELRLLYEACKFTVFPSYYEGWGIPVGESLAFGKLCVASNRTSIPEVGGDHCIYFDPASPEQIDEALVEAVNRTKSNTSFKFKGLRTWNQVSSDLVTAVLGSRATSRGTRQILAPELIFDQLAGSKNV